MQCPGWTLVASHTPLQYTSQTSSIINIFLQCILALCDIKSSPRSHLPEQRSSQGKQARSKHPLTPSFRIAQHDRIHLRTAVVPALCCLGHVSTMHICWRAMMSYLGRFYSAVRTAVLWWQCCTERRRILGSSWDWCGGPGDSRGMAVDLILR